MHPGGERRGGGSRRQLPTRPALFRGEVPAAVQSRGFERFPGKPMLLSGERKEADEAEGSLEGNLTLPQPLISSHRQLTGGGWEEGGDLASGFSQRIFTKLVHLS